MNASLVCEKMKNINITVVQSNPIMMIRFIYYYFMKNYFNKMESLSKPGRDNQGLPIYQSYPFDNQQNRFQVGENIAIKNLVGLFQVLKLLNIAYSYFITTKQYVNAK